MEPFSQLRVPLPKYPYLLSPLNNSILPSQHSDSMLSLKMKFRTGHTWMGQCWLGAEIKLGT